MKLKRYANVTQLLNQEEPQLLPARSVVMAGGFLQESAPVALFGRSPCVRTFLLLTFEQRSAFARVATGGRSDDFDDRTQRIGPDRDDPAVLRPNGSVGFWWNAENLWVSTDWLREVAGKIPNDAHTHKTRMLVMLADDAAWGA